MAVVPRNLRGVFHHRIEVFGRSVLGANLEVILPKSGVAETLVLAGQHGDEPETTALLSSVIREIPEDELRCAVVLAANPDGLLRGTRGNANGVDLNRNFPTSNWKPDKIVYRWSSADPRDTELSPGAEPASEPETQALLGLIEKIKPTEIVSIHAPLGCVDDPKLSELARWLSDLSGLKLVEEIGYPTPGSFGTWGLEKELTLVTFELPHDSIEGHRMKLGDTVNKLLRRSVKSESLSRAV